MYNNICIYINIYYNNIYNKYLIIIIIIYDIAQMA